ncbi:MAG: hypothetical protein HXS52_01385 [Theionarchaea archaeon]|nr:hypothetical protein [Theionarchaea archaeon]MBU7036555.1 hypothetical protein [Theionarchaea archaeon]
MKGKKAMLLVLILAMSIPSVISSGDSISVEYTFSTVFMNDHWVIVDGILQEIAGEPVVPCYPARILLPQDAEVTDVSVSHSSPIIQQGIDIQWGQPPCTFSDTPVKVGRNNDIYGSDNPYPGKMIDVLSVQSFRGFKILYVNLFPLQYQPKSQTATLYETITVNVKTQKGPVQTLYRGYSADKEAVIDLVDNPETVDSYTTPAQSVSPLLESGTYEYIIITSDALTPTFQALANHKAAFVNGTKIVDIQWIYSNYTGLDDPMKVRNFITDAYNTWGTNWCLLGGDVDVVPYRGFYVRVPGGRDPDMAADMYFGCLDGTFDADGDERYAEENDDIDWLEEVFIGRAPVETVDEAQIFVNKVIAYELAPKQKICQFHQSRLSTGNTPDSRVIAWDCEYWTPSDYEKRELFEEDGNVSKSDWIAAWNGKPLMFQHVGHGNTTVYDICYEVGGEVAWYNADVPSLVNTDFWPIHMSVACITGEFEANDCLAEMYVKDDAGAIATMMNDNYGWYSSLDASKYSGEFLETMFRALFSDGKQNLGELLNQAKSYWISAAESNGTYRWCYFEINLMGDPETPCLTQRAF